MKLEPLTERLKYSSAVHLSISGSAATITASLDYREGLYSTERSSAFFVREAIFLCEVTLTHKRSVSDRAP